jgi:uncharacterized protein
MTTIDNQTILDTLAEKQRVDNDLNWFVIKNEVFAIPFEEGFIVYAPLHNKLLKINQQAFSQILFYDEIGEQSINPAITKLLKDLDTVEIPKNFTSGQKFIPGGLTLSPTSACQLACSYCYINGGDNPRDLDEITAKASILYNINKTIEAGRKNFKLEFHGQGEPTSNWKLFKFATEFTKEQCTLRELECSFSVVTNGVLNDSQIAFLKDNNFGVGVSIDGFSEENDVHRPMRNKGSAFKFAFRTIKKFDEIKIDYGIRGVVTSLNVETISDFVKFIGENTSCKYVEFEPLSQVGRAITTGINGVEITKYISNFRKALTVGKEYEIKVSSSMRMDTKYKPSFCGAYGGFLNFVVNTEGYISSCYEVLDIEDPRSNVFVYGKYDKQKNDFEIYEDKVKFLEGLNPNSFNHCQTCFAKWHCAGGCISRNMASSDDNFLEGFDKDRCYATRQFAKEELVLQITKQ